MHLCRIVVLLQSLEVELLSRRVKHLGLGLERHSATQSVRVELELDSRLYEEAAVEKASQMMSRRDGGPLYPIQRHGG